MKLLPESVPASSPYTGNMYKGACTIKCPCAVVVPTVFAKYLSASISSSQLPDVSLHAETFEKPVNQSGDGAIIVPVDDSGTVLAFDPAAQAQGYKLSIHMVGQTDLYGTYDKVPSPRQVAAILDGKDPQTAQAQAIVAYAANGEATMQPGGASGR